MLTQSSSSLFFNSSNTFGKIICGQAAEQCQQAMSSFLSLTGAEVMTNNNATKFAAGACEIYGLDAPRYYSNKLYFEESATNPTALINAFVKSFDSCYLEYNSIAGIIGLSVIAILLSAIILPHLYKGYQACRAKSCLSQPDEIIELEAQTNGNNRAASDNNALEIAYTPL